MADALPALEQVIDEVERLAAAVKRCRSASVPPEKVSAAAKAIAGVYYEQVRAELARVARRGPLVDEIDFVVGLILQLTSGPREKSAYLGQINELRPYLEEARIEILKARGEPKLVLSETENDILNTLAQMLPAAAASYEQALRDIAEGNRVSWRGPAFELREVLREVMDHLAPPDKVMAEPGFELEKDQARPTQRQKVRFLLKKRRRSATVAEESLDRMDESIALLARSTYSRGSAAHASADAPEVRKLKRYIDAVLGDLLETAGSSPE